MRKEIQDYLDSAPDIKFFVRMNPDWYRRLSRYPGDIIYLKQAADDFYGRTFGKRMDRLNERAGFLSMLLSLAEAMNEVSEEKKDADKTKKEG